MNQNGATTPERPTDTTTCTTIADQTWSGHLRTVNVEQVETQIDCLMSTDDERFSVLTTRRGLIMF